MIHYKEFDNGLRLIINKMDSLLSVSMGIIVHTGASQESDSEDGISHFIEHMMFKGTKKRTAFMISDEMDRIGAQVNAFTAKDITCYYAKSTTGHAAEAFEILSDLFLESVFPEEEMAREKGVVIEEINMNEDTPDDLCLDVLANAYFGKRGYGRTILGPRKNVEKFTADDIGNYMDKHYAPQNIVIAMAGNIDINLAESLVAKYYACHNRRCCDRKPVKIELKGQSLLKHKDIEQVHIGIAYPSVKRGDELFDATQILNSVLGGGMSSRLFQTVREKLGLAYTVYSYTTSYEECGALSVYAGVNADRYLESAEAIYGCINEIKKNGITKDEFERGKEQLVSSLIFSRESTSSQMLVFGKELLYKDEVYDFEKRLGRLNSVTYDDVLTAIGSNFDESHMAKSLVGAADKPL